MKTAIVGGKFNVRKNIFSTSFFSDSKRNRQLKNSGIARVTKSKKRYNVKKNHQYFF